MNEKALPRFLTLDEVSKLTQRSKRCLYVDIAVGKLRSTKLGRSVRISEEDYLAYVEAARK